MVLTPISRWRKEQRKKRNHLTWWCARRWKLFLLIILNLSSSAESSFGWLPGRKKKKDSEGGEKYSSRTQTSWCRKKKGKILWYIVSRRLGKRDYNKSSHLSVSPFYLFFAACTNLINVHHLSGDLLARERLSSCFNIKWEIKTEFLINFVAVCMADSSIDRSGITSAS